MAALRVVCVKWGDKYGPQYVTTLKRMVARHLDLPHTFECFTDVPIDGVHCLPLTVPWGSWWAKMELFKPGVITQPTLYLDLDVVIVGSLNWVEDYADATLAAAYDWGRGTMYEREVAGCLMVMSGSCHETVYEEFRGDVDIRRLHPHGDQTWITEVLGADVTEIPPPHVMSYKHHCRSSGGPPGGASVIAFHGLPKPHEIKDQWVVDAWR